MGGSSSHSTRPYVDRSRLVGFVKPTKHLWPSYVLVSATSLENAANHCLPAIRLRRGYVAAEFRGLKSRLGGCLSLR